MGKFGFGWDVAVQATDCEGGDKCASGPKGVERMKEASAHLCRWEEEGADRPVPCMAKGQHHSLEVYLRVSIVLMPESTFGQGVK